MITVAIYILQVYEELTPSPPPTNCCFGLASSAASLPTSASRLASSLSCLADYHRKSKLAAEEEIEAAKIIERSEDIRKPKNDPHSYRYVLYIDVCTFIIYVCHPLRVLLTFFKMGV